MKDDSECKGHCKCKLGLCCFVAGDKKKGISLKAQGIGMRKRLVRSEGSGKMERMLLAGGFCDLASKYSVKTEGMGAPIELLYFK